MQRRVFIMLTLFLMMISLSGCLVRDMSTTVIDDEKIEEIKGYAEQITDDFFKYNEYVYDPEEDNYSYNAQELIDLFNKDKAGKIMAIDPIMGPEYKKSFATLREELEEQKTIFEAQNDSQNTYELVFKDAEGNPTYEITFEDQKITQYDAIYYVKFQVYEELNGERLLTDNGIITFELKREDEGWLINYLTVDFRELGSISL